MLLNDLDLDYNEKLDERKKITKLIKLIWENLSKYFLLFLNLKLNLATILKTIIAPKTLKIQEARKPTNLP